MALILNALAMMALPLAVAVWARRLTRGRWAWLGIGALGFVGSQVVHLPLLLWVWPSLTRAGVLPGFGATADMIVVGLLAAACEEPARALAFRFGVPLERGRSAALMFGAGHGGAEALILGALALLEAINILGARGMSAEQLVALGMTPDAAEVAVAQVAQALAVPWYEVFGGAFERAITIPFHIACSFWVMAAMRRRRAWPFVVALVAHAAVDAAAGLLGEAGQSGWALELEVAAMAGPFAIGTFVWASRAEPAQADAST